MSLEERMIKSVLLKERWSLIQSGHNRKQIKISKNQIYISGRLHGEVLNSGFQKVGNNFPPPSQPMDHQQSSHTEASNQEQSSCDYR